MIKSMTGFGRKTLETDELSVQIEMKTLNSKFLDTHIKIPSVFSEKELDIKKVIGQKMERGKVLLTLEYIPKNAEHGLVNVNGDLVKSYYKSLKAIAEDLGEEKNSDLLRVAMTMPDVLTKKLDEQTLEKDWNVIEGVLLKTIDACNAYRENEGAVLGQDLEERLKKIETCLEKVEERDPERIVKIREKLTTQVNDFVNSDNFDPNRFEQELIYYIEKLDISEEKVRLKNHLKYFLETLNLPKSSGKKLNFISQEIGREINTIGSKANDAEIQRLVVNMKEELEKIKEQVLNII